MSSHRRRANTPESIDSPHLSIVSDSETYRVSDDEDYLFVDSNGGATEIVLPPPDEFEGEMTNSKTTVIDTGNARYNNIRISADGNRLVDGEPSVSIRVARGSRSFICDSENWHSIDTTN